MGYSRSIFSFGNTRMTFCEYLNHPGIYHADGIFTDGLGTCFGEVCACGKTVQLFFNLRKKLVQVDMSYLVHPYSHWTLKC